MKLPKHHTNSHIHELENFLRTTIVFVRFDLHYPKSHHLRGNSKRKKMYIPIFLQLKKKTKTMQGEDVVIMETMM